MGTDGGAAAAPRAVLRVAPGPRRVTAGPTVPGFHLPLAGGALRTLRPPRRPDLRGAQKILVVRLDYIGDLILTTPFLAGLRAAAPAAEITLAVLPRAFALAETLPSVDRVVGVAAETRGRVWFEAARVPVLAGFLDDYRAGRFDLAAVARWDADFNGALQVAQGCRPPVLAAFAEASIARKAILNRGDDRYATHLVDDRAPGHEVEHLARLLVALGGGGGGGRGPARIALTPGDRTAACAFLASAGAGDRLLAVAPFAADRRRMLPPERLAPLVGDLARRLGATAVILGGEGDAGPSAELAAEIRGAVAAAGRLPLRVSAAVVEAAQGFLGVDSGLAHVAAALGVPTAVLSCHPATGGPAHPHAPERFRPWGSADRVLVVRPDAPRAPCADGCSAAEPHCILAVDRPGLPAELAAFFRRAGRD